MSSSFENGHCHSLWWNSDCSRWSFVWIMVGICTGSLHDLSLCNSDSDITGDSPCCRCDPLFHILEAPSDSACGMTFFDDHDLHSLPIGLGQTFLAEATPIVTRHGERAKVVVRAPFLFHNCCPLDGTSFPVSEPVPTPWC